MKYFMPQVCMHERKSLLSVDVHTSSKDGKYRMVTSSVQQNIAIWEFEFENKAEDERLGLCFIASLEGHFTTINQVRFSPNAEVNILASGDVHGRIFIWKLSDKPCTDRPAEGFPPNREKWIRCRVLYHESDVTSICWNPTGKYLASVSGDATLRVHEALTGRHKFIVRNLRYFPNGVSYDPLGKYIVTMSTDRKMDLICAEKGTRLRHFGTFELPHLFIGNTEFKKKDYQMFHDDLLTAYTRVCAFSPCGQLVVVPAGRLQTSSESRFYCSYVYKRWELNKDRPAIILRSPKHPTFLIRFCPTIFELATDSPNYSGLPYRVIWLALTQDEIILYDSQHPHAIGLIQDLTYKCLSDATWTKDGKTVVISDTEEYCHYLHFDDKEFGNEIKTIPQMPDSPSFKKKKLASKTVIKKAIASQKKTITPKKKKGNGLKQSVKRYKSILPSWDSSIISKKELSEIFTPIRQNNKQAIDGPIFDKESVCREDGQAEPKSPQKDNVKSPFHHSKTALLDCLLPKKDSHDYSVLSPRPKTEGPPKKRLSIITLL